MTAVEVAPAPLPVIRRTNRGSGHSYTIDGVSVESVSTAKDAVAKPALINWAAVETARYAAFNWDELSQLPESMRLSKLEKARFESRDAAANRGTRVHSLAQQLAAGVEIEITEEVDRGLVDAYLKFTDEWEPVELLTETPVGNRRYGYAGTLDCVADLVDGKRWLLDWKTGRSGIFRESALQLAAYRHAEAYVDAEGVSQPMLQVDHCGCVWLRDDGTYELVPVNASPDVFRVFLHALQVARFLAADSSDFVAASGLTPPEASR